MDEIEWIGIFYSTLTDALPPWPMWRHGRSQVEAAFAGAGRRKMHRFSRLKPAIHASQAAWRGIVTRKHGSILHLAQPLLKKSGPAATLAECLANLV